MCVRVPVYVDICVLKSSTDISNMVIMSQMT